MPCGFQSFYAGRFAVQHFEGDVMESHFLLTAPGSLGLCWLWQLEPCGPAALRPCGPAGAEALVGVDP